MIERRLAVSRLEVRDDSSAPTLTGYASTFNEPYSMGWYTETIAPSAFARTLGRSPDVRLLINHGGLPLARTTSGTLTLDADSRGLHVEAVLDPSDPDVQALLPKMRRGDLTQMSIGFRTLEDEWSKDMKTRTMRSLDLDDGDVSVVAYPANPNASAQIRSVGAPTLDAIRSAFNTMDSRAATDEDIVSVLTRALAYFTAIDMIVDAAQDELAEILGIPNPDDDESSEIEPVDDMPARMAAIGLELRRRRLAIAG